MRSSTYYIVQECEVYVKSNSLIMVIVMQWTFGKIQPLETVTSYMIYSVHLFQGTEKFGITES